MLVLALCTIVWIILTALHGGPPWEVHWWPWATSDDGRAVADIGRGQAHADDAL